ncbi:phosphatase PAP2 family protein [Streptomyces sp. FXJ1.172]|uniref:phosphatase PAP2 family protein n=1 Tax=Streptomyces sp. FXJ1.172 TaxID=710705 RepID=UPI0007CFAEC3|nr:phosphatase PAP2 family protein [Streptomyces sp. FXJ1.172]WEO93727.1 phosphatase PAP2 family protein [Streptomyces sp. FXJ1.172]
MNRARFTEHAGTVALGAWMAFAALAAVLISDQGAPLYLDRALLHWSVGHRPPVAVAVARGLTDTGTGAVPYVLALLAAVIAGRTVRQRLLAALLGVVCLGAAQAVRYGVMDLVARARPPQYDWQTHASGWSFPSGHTTTSALTAGLLILAVGIRAPRGRTVLAALVAVWGAAVGLTRVYLGVHWFTDVIGGWLFAAGWLALSVCAVARWLPARHLPGAPWPGRSRPSDPATGPVESHAPKDPHRRGRSRPA